MDISDKIREKKDAIGKIAAEEQLVRSRLAELKQLAAEQVRRQAALDALKAEEADLLSKLE